jgi:uroporphyrinogen III methyltransferase/synthase
MNDPMPLVFLVGAGPGDPGLLTLRAVECLSQADLVLYDRLVNPGILDHAPVSANKVCVTELASHHTERCVPVQEMMIEAAQQGQCVVRLKGGDPLVFGRGAEEAEALRHAGIDFEIVPGITAGLGAAAYAGIPLTHRLHSSAVAFVTGHECPGKENSAVDWKALAAFPGTLVVYMGMTHLEAVVDSLLRAGKDAATPAAVVQNATTCDQRTVEAPLGELVDATRGHGLKAPALILVGSVVSLRSQLQWFEKRPLFGKKVLITRPREQASALARRIEQLGGAPLLLPAVAIGEPADWGPVDRALADLKSYQWLVFTSANGVRSFLNRLLEKGQDLRTLGHLQIAAIGPVTASALRSYHLQADFVPPEFRSEALAADLVKRVAGQRILLARADRGREVLREELTKVADVVQVAVYSQHDAVDSQSSAMEALRRGEVDFITLTSSNIARAMFNAIDEAALAPIRSGRTRIICISPVTSETVRELGLPIAAEAEVYTSEGVVEKLIELAGRYNKN